jgi:hypothetical protein
MIGRSRIECRDEDKCKVECKGEGGDEMSSLFPDENTLYTADEVLVSEWVKKGLVIKVKMDDRILYYRPVRSMETPLKRPRLAPLRQTPTQKHLASLQRELDKLRDRHRKLKMLAKTGTEHGDLPALIAKWRGACQQALTELKNFVQPPMRSRTVLNSLGVRYDTLELELSTDDEKEGESPLENEEGYSSYEK